MASEKAKARAQWSRLFAEARDSDSWGQMLEAIDHYQKLIQKIKSQEQGLDCSPDEKSEVSRILLCLGLRLKALKAVEDGEEGGSAVSSDVGMSYDEVQKLTQVFERLFAQPLADFPIQMSKYQVQRRDKEVEKISTTQTELQGGLLKKWNAMPVNCVSMASASSGRTPSGLALTIKIERMGLKNAMQYIDPLITVSALDGSGAPIVGESPQDTPISMKIREMSVEFGLDVHMQTPVNRYPEGSAIFFEFKHYKPKKKKISTKAWCFMELDEIKPGAQVLEIYEKPTDVKRKKLRLLSVKPLYLHLVLSLRENA